MSVSSTLSFAKHKKSTKVQQELKKATSTQILSENKEKR
jgi:hypothetical protein